MPALAAAIGAVRSASTSAAALLILAPATEQTDSLFVALRIDTLSFHPLRVAGFFTSRAAQ